MLIESERDYDASSTYIHKMWYEEEGDVEPETEMVTDFTPHIYVEKGAIDKFTNFRRISEMHLDENNFSFVTLAEGISDYEEGYESLEGEELIKLYVPNTRNIRDIREKFEETDDEGNVTEQYHHEADVGFTNRYMINKMENIEKTPLRIHYMDIEVSDFEGFGNVKTAKKPIMSISFYDDFEKEYYVYTYKDAVDSVEKDDYTVKVFENERQMILGYLEYIQNTKPQILTGWNFVKFDIQYLVNRIENGRLMGPGEPIEGEGAPDIGDKEKLFNSKPFIDGPTPTEAKNMLSPMRDQFSQKSRERGLTWNPDDRDFVRISGVEIIDLLKAYKMYQYGEKESYSLDNIAKDEIDAEKIVLDKGFFEMYDEEFDLFLDYNKRDVELTVELNEKLEILDFWDEMRRICKCSMEEILISMRQVDNYILDYVHWNIEENLVLPSKSDNEKPKFAGGYVEDAEPGLTENIFVSDLSSLYPSLIISFNLSPEVLDEDGEIVIDKEEGMVFSKEQGLLPQIFDELFDRRYDYKDKMKEAKKGSLEEDIYDNRQRGIKIVMNCFSGDTELFTPQGIKNIKDMEVGDKVYSINPETHRLEIKKVTETTKQKNEYGELVHIKDTRHDWKVTPNHRFLTKIRDYVNINDAGKFSFNHYEDLNDSYLHYTPNHDPVIKEGDENQRKHFYWSEFIDESIIWIDTEKHGRTFKNNLPDEISSKLEYSQSRTQYKLDISIYKNNRELLQKESDEIYIQKKPHHSSIPDKINTNTFIEFVAWYITEGSSRKPVNGSGGKSSMVNISKYEDSPCREEIKDILENMNLNYYSDSENFTVNNSIVYEFTKNYCGSRAREKKIPEFIFDQSVDIRELFRSTMMKGDGDKTRQKNRYSTISEELAEEFAKLSLELGFKPNIKKDSGTYRVWQYQDGSFNTDNETEDHDGYVYCVKVEDNQTVVSGRNKTFDHSGQTSYGVLTNPYYRLFEPKVGKSITKLGREIIKWSGKYAENYKEDFDYIYSDTDSIFVSYDKDQTDLLDIQEFIDDLEESYKEFGEQYGVPEPERLIMEFEKQYSKMFMTQAKKRYAARKVSDDSGSSQFVEFENGDTVLLKESDDWVGVGDEIDSQKVVRCGEVNQKMLDEPELDVTGFELVRSDYPEFAKELQREVLWKIVSGVKKSEIMDHIKSKRNKLLDGEYSLDEVGIPKGINKKLGEYQSVGPHIRGVKYSNKYLGTNLGQGDKVKLAYVSRAIGNTSTDVVAFQEENTVPDDFAIDWKKMEKKLIKQPLDRIFKGMKWNHSDYTNQMKITDL